MGRARSLWWIAIGSTGAGVALAGPPAGSAQDGEAETGGLRLRPSISWSSGDHRVDLNFQNRYRYESWKARSKTTDGIHGNTMRLGIGYSNSILKIQTIALCTTTSMI